MVVGLRPRVKEMTPHPENDGRPPAGPRQRGSLASRVSAQHPCPLLTDVNTPLPSVVTKKCLLALPHTAWGQTQPWVRITTLEEPGGTWASALYKGSPPGAPHMQPGWRTSKAEGRERGTGVHSHNTPRK